MNPREAMAILRKMRSLVEGKPVRTSSVREQEGDEDPMQATALSEPLEGVSNTFREMTKKLYDLKDPKGLKEIVGRLNSAADDYQDDLRPQLEYYAKLAGVTVNR